METNTVQTRSGFGLGTVLFLIFLVLKLTHTITWSWWWVTAPLWIPWVIFFAFGLLILLFVLVVKAVAK